MNWLRQNYERNFLRFDFAAAAIVVTVALIWTALTRGLPQVSSDLGPIKSSLYSSLFSLGGTLLGFLISAASIVIAFSELPRLQLLRDSGQSRTIAVVFFDAMRWLGILAGLSLSALFFDTSDNALPFLTFATFSVAVLCAFRLYRCIWLLKRLTFIAVGHVGNQTRLDRRAA